MLIIFMHVFLLLKNFQKYENHAITRAKLQYIHINLNKIKKTGYKGYEHKQCTALHNIIAYSYKKYSIILRNIKHKIYK